MKLFNVITTSFGLNTCGTDCIEINSISTWPTKEAAKKALVEEFCGLCQKYRDFIGQVHLFDNEGTIYFDHYIKRGHDECKSQISVTIAEIDDENA